MWDPGEDHGAVCYARTQTRSAVMRSTQEVTFISTG
jgi:hypothetical protein